MKLHEWKTRIQSGEHLLGTMVTTFASVQQVSARGGAEHAPAEILDGGA